MKLGIDPLRIVDYTPYEVMLLVKQKREKETSEFEKDITLAWHIEAFSRQKKLPKLEKILKDIRRKPKQKNFKGDEILKAMAREQGVIIK